MSGHKGIFGGFGDNSELLFFFLLLVVLFTSGFGGYGKY